MARFINTPSSDFYHKFGGGGGGGGGGGAKPPAERLFCLNELPPQPNTRYIWLDDHVWDDSLYWIG